MTKASILFDNLKVVNYELSTHTACEQNFGTYSFITTYFVKWICQTGSDIEQQITKEEYDELYQELNVKAHSNIGM